MRKKGFLEKEWTFSGKRVQRYINLIHTIIEMDLNVIIRQLD